TGDNSLDARNTSLLYQRAVDSLVFKPAGLPGIHVNEPLNQAASLYSYPYRGGRGYVTGDYTGTAGAIGWYMTADQAGQLFARVLSSADQSVLSSSLKTTLLENRYGCYAALLGDQEVVYYHDGWQWATDPSFPGGYRGLRSIWMKYPGQVTIVLLVNALGANRLFPSNNGMDIMDYVDQAYGRARQLQNGRTSPYLPLKLEHAEPH
ncbi:serine hydrolase, partial [Fibrella forsythiae]|nr:serine hydrolase [Fibrella forsythiae]